MPTLSELLKDRVEASQSNESLEKRLKLDAKTYHEKWLFAVQCFQKQINKDCFKQGRHEFSFIAIMLSVKHIKEIDDLRWFYKECLRYSRTKDKRTGKKNTFSRCFWGSLKTTNRKF